MRPNCRIGNIQPGFDGIFEIGIEYESNSYRVLCYFDKGNIVVLLNSFQKNTQKTPLKEIALAEKPKKQYFLDKNIDDENERKGAAYNNVNQQRRWSARTDSPIDETRVF